MWSYSRAGAVSCIRVGAGSRLLWLVDFDALRFILSLGLARGLILDFL